MHIEKPRKQSGIGVKGNKSTEQSLQTEGERAGNALIKGFWSKEWN